MDQKLEIEYKTLLSQTHAACLLSLGIFTFSGKQSNVYHDTADNFFQSLNIVIRLREKNSKFLFTAKEPTNKGLKETEFFLENASITDENISSYTKKFRDNVILHQTGSSITYRYTYDDEYGQWCLDFNVFEYTSDVELEYELHQGIENKKQHFLDHLKTWNVPYKPCDSKFIRMLQQNKD